MTDAQEKSLIEALKKVDAHGDVASAHVQDPMTMVLRQRAIQADLMRWDDSRGHYVLTGTGRSRISARSRVLGAVVRFKTRNDPSLTGSPPRDEWPIAMSCGNGRRHMAFRHRDSSDEE